MKYTVTITDSDLASLGEMEACIYRFADERLNRAIDLGRSGKCSAAILECYDAIAILEALDTISKITDKFRDRVDEIEEGLEQKSALTQ